MPRDTAAPANHTHASAQLDAAGDQSCFGEDLFSELFPEYWDRIRMHLFCPMHGIANAMKDVYRLIFNVSTKTFTAARR
jgi:hypothetical protein